MDSMRTVLIAAALVFILAHSNKKTSKLTWALCGFVIRNLLWKPVRWALKGFRLPRLGLGKLRPTRDERRWMKRFGRSYWQARAEARGLDGVYPAKPKLTPSGIKVPVRLEGKWTTAELRKAEDRIRNLIGAKRDVRMEITAGGRGGWAQIVIRSRSAADGDDGQWSEKETSFGVDTVTGDLVRIPTDQRLLIAGASGSGKSVASRPLMYLASEGELNALVIIDLKRVEGRLWDHRARVASTPEAVMKVVDELVAEMDERLDAMPKGQASHTPSLSRPVINVVVDEGAEVNAKVKKALDGLETLARMGRAAEIHLWWMTQKPTTSGKDAGIPTQIDAQIIHRICLAVATPTEARTVLGENAQKDGWDADKLPSPGYAYYQARGSKPHPIKVRRMTDKQVIGLPDQPLWSRHSEPAEATRPAEATPAELVMKALAGATEPVAGQSLIKSSGLGRSQGYALLKEMAEDGRIRKHSHGKYSL